MCGRVYSIVESGTHKVLGYTIHAFMTAAATLSCAYLEEHTGPEEMLHGTKQPKIVGARDIVQYPRAAVKLCPGLCDNGSRENVFMTSSEVKRHAVTWSSRKRWEAHQRQVERLNERRQLYDASIQHPELNNHFATAVDARW